MARIASATLRPCDTRTSTCRSLATISSGLCPFFAISVLLRLKAIPQDGPLHWFIAEFGGSCGEEAPAKQVELSAAIHGPLQQLETVDLPLGLAAAPGQAECGADRGPVLVEAGREALDGPLTAAARFRQPCAESRDGGGASALGPAAAADDAAEPAAEVHDLGRLVILQNARDLCGGFGIEVVRLAQRVPRQLFRRRQRRGWGRWGRRFG